MPRYVMCDLARRRRESPSGTVNVACSFARVERDARRSGCARRRSTATVSNVISAAFSTIVVDGAFSVTSMVSRAAERRRRQVRRHRDVVVLRHDGVGKALRERRAMQEGDDGESASQT